MTVLTGARVVTPDADLDPGWVEIDDGRVIALGVDEPPPHTAGPGSGARVDLSGYLVVPGFVDMHVHGGGGASYTVASAEQAGQVVTFHRRHGTTTAMASLVSTSADLLERQVQVLSELVADGVVAGIHLEGPYLSEERCGAHDPASLRPPDLAEIDRLLHLGAGAVRMVTLAPELEGGLTAVRHLVQAGVVVALGHTAASYETTRAAVDAGATVGTHLFNGMPPVHHREPGPAVALLGDTRVTVEMICDGVHVHHAIVGAAARAAGAHRVALVTDAMTAAGVGDGDYLLGALRVRVDGGKARLPDTGTIAGSTLTADAAFRHAVCDAGLPVTDVARMLATTPARALGIDSVGRIAPGVRADLVVLDSGLRVHRVMAAGRWVDGAGEETA